MATITKRHIEVAHTKTGGPPYTRTYPEASGQTFKRGELVFLVAGKVTICGTDPALILGVAAQDATNVVDTPIKVTLAEQDTVFVGNLGVAQATALTQVGLRVGVIKDAGGTWHPDTGDVAAANIRVLIIGLDQRDTVLDVNGRVHFVFLETFTQASRLTAASAQLV